MFDSHLDSRRRPSRAALLSLAVAGLTAGLQGHAHAQYSPANTIDLTSVNTFASLTGGIAGSRQAGYFSGTATSGSDHAVLWNSSANNFVDLNPAGMTASRATSTSGPLQGGYGAGTATGSFNHALLWSGTAASALDLHPVGYTNSYIYSLSPAGSQQVGSATAASDPNNIPLAMLWNGSAASATSLHPAGLNLSEALSTDGTRQVGHGSGTATGGAEHALLWSGTAASVVDLHTASLSYSFAYGISGNSQVGYGGGTATGFVNHALLWHNTAASLVDLHPAGFLSSFARAANTSSQVGYGTPTGSPGGALHALLWSSTAASVVDLHAFVPDAPTQTVATGIDLYGNISGYAVYSGSYHAISWFAANTFRSTTPASTWNTAANWIAGVPTSGNVNLLSTDGLARTVSYDQSNAALTLGNLLLDATGGGSVLLNQSANTLTTATTSLGLGGAASMTLSGGAHNTSSLKLNAGTYTQSGGQTNISGALVTQPSSASVTLSLSGGTLTAQSADLSGADTFAWTAGTLRLTGTSTASILTGVTSLAVPAAGTLRASRGIDVATLTVQGNAHMLPNGSTTGGSSVTTLTIAGATDAWTGSLDLADNALIVRSTTAGEKNGKISTLANQLVSGRNGGAWNGKGITSSLNPATPNTTMALVDNSSLGLATFQGQPLDANSLIIVRALKGDADLSGNVDLGDFDRWFANVGGTTFNYAQGDFDLSGNVDLGDFDVWFANVGAQLAPIVAAPAPVPEAGTLALLVLGCSTLSLRQRRRAGSAR